MPTKTPINIYGWVGAVILTAAMILTALFLPLPGNTPPAEETVPVTTTPTPSFTREFGYEDGYLSCLSEPSVLGIDVSVHQGQIDYQQVKAAGVEFVMIRVGYRGSVEGLLITDEMAQSNYANAKAAGLKVGAYIFTQSISVEEGLEDAEYALDIIKDWELDMPLVYDWEIIDESYRNAQVDMRTLTDTTKAFCQAVEQAGYDAMVYFNPTQAEQNFYLEELADYGHWLAHYTDQYTYPHAVDMWQYTCTGTVPGIEGDVDIDLYFPEK